jgi:hypothetical protein
MMWTRIGANASVDIEAHDLLRWGGVPVATIKKRLAGDDRRGLPPRWECSLLECSGVSARPLTLGLDLPLSEVKGRCETELKSMGWTRNGVARTNGEDNADPS